MSCFPCFSSQKSKKTKTDPPSGEVNASSPPENNKQTTKEEPTNVENGNIAATTFTFRELATATKNFRPECLLGEGGFGRVYKGRLEKIGQDVAVKQLDRNGLQGNKEFLVEVLMLSLLHHENLVNLIGYCADGDQRLLVYDYMSGGSVEDHLLDIGPDDKPLDWFTRMKIASGAAKGLEYLHDKANPPVIYRDLKSSNILLDDEFNPKLSDFGLAKLGPASGAEKTHVSSRVMGTYGYCAPEYARTGQLTVKSDIYSFGVVLLELITGRRVIDTTRPNDEQNLVTWAQPIFRDPKKFPEMADPRLGKQFPERGLNQAVAIAAMCLQDEASVRPLISDVVTALSFLSVVSDEGMPKSLPTPTQPPPEEEVADEGDEDNVDDQQKNDEDEGNQNQEEDGSEYEDGSVYSEEEESEKEGQQDDVREARAVNASQKSSNGSHQDRSVSCTSRESNQGSREVNVSLRRKSSRISQYGSFSSSASNNSRKSSQDVRVSSSSQISSRKSQDENASISLSENSTKESPNGSGSVSPSQDSIKQSQNEGIPPKHKKGTKNRSASLTSKLSRKFSHKSSKESKTRSASLKPQK